MNPRHLVIAALVVAFSGAAQAHTVGLSRGVYLVAGDRLELELVFARPEVVSFAKGLDKDGDGALTEAELSAGKDALAETAAQIQVTADGAACAGVVAGQSLTEEDGLALRLVYTCPRAIDAVVVKLALLDVLAKGHRHLAHIVAGAHEADLVAFAASPTLTFTRTEGAATRGAPPVSDYFVIGIEHIIGGIDHLLFLFGLILIGGRFRSLLAVVTAFTIAHSITLGLAVMGVWAPSGDIIEPAIALSIAYVGVENFFVGDAAKRWRITFPFGLIHGFGFAGALSEVGLPQDDVPLALVLFNVGVEAGQLIVLAVVLPVLMVLRRRGWLDARVVRVLSAFVVVAGVYWFIERTFFGG